MTSLVSKHHPKDYYTWGNNCEARTLAEDKNLSVKHESMPPLAEEELHYHKQAQQFFYVTKGKAVFEIEDVIFIVTEGEGLHIEAGKKHRIMNKEETALEFIICSQPSIKNDRYNLA